MIFNHQLLEATSTTRLTLRMCHRCVYKCRIVLDCYALLLAVLHRPMETTSLQTELVYLFSKFSSMGNVYSFFILTSSLMFLNVVDLQGSLPRGIAFDCGRLFEITAFLPRHH